jgi:hypothetical protein
LKCPSPAIILLFCSNWLCRSFSRSFCHNCLTQHINILFLHNRLQCKACSEKFE